MKHCFEQSQQLTDEQLISIDNIATFILTQPSIWVLVSGMLGSVVAYQWLFGWGLLDTSLVILAFVLRSFVEWGIHYYIHHAMPLPFTNIRLKSIIYRLHIEHHRKPWKADELFMKGKSMFVMLSIPFLLLAFISLRLAILSVLFAAMILFFNEVFHAFAHANVSFKNKWLMRVINNHRNHHQLNPNKYYGVSSLLADRLLKTTID